MQITYNVKLPKRQNYGSGRKSEEVMEIEAFLQGTAKNMCFTYDDDVQAKSRFRTIGAWRRKSSNGELVDIFRDGTRLYVVRLSPKEIKERRTPT